MLPQKYICVSVCHDCGKERKLIRLEHKVFSKSKLVCKDCAASLLHQLLWNIVEYGK